MSRNLTTDEYRRELDHSISERDFQKRVELIFREWGWDCYHTQHSKGSTPGFPDLVMIYPADPPYAHPCVAVELKVGRNRITQAQGRWLYLFERVEGAQTFVWYPRHLDEIHDVAEKQGRP